MLKRENQEILKKDPLYMEMTECVKALLFCSADVSFQPVIWAKIIEVINKAILENNPNLTHESPEHGTYFGFVVKFVINDVMHAVKVFIGFVKDESNTVVKQGHLVVEILNQSTGVTSKKELQAFNKKGLLNRYVKKGKAVANLISESVFNPRSLDTFYKHCLLGIQSYESEQGYLSLLDDNKTPLVLVKRFQSESSVCAMSATANFQAKNEDATLTSSMEVICSTTVKKDNPELLNLHTTSVVHHTLTSN
jgi:hypothetical protein